MTNSEKEEKYGDDGQAAPMRPELPGDVENALR
jgi:hypothetical protein